MTRERWQPIRSAKTALTGLVAGQGYRNFDVLGPFTGRQGGQYYVVTIYDGDNSALYVLRGSFEELQEQIKALPGR